MIIQSTYDSERLPRRRLEIAEHTSIVSLRYQTRKPIVQLTVHNNDPLKAERIALFESTGCEVNVLMRDGWKLYCEDWELPQGRKVVSRMDDDDIVAIDFCAATHAAAPPTGEMILIWPNGYVFWRQMIFALNHKGIQFVSMVTDEMKDPHQEQHWGYHRKYPTRNVSYEKGWIWVRHGDAATSTLPRYRTKHLQRIDITRCPVNLRAIVRATEESGLPSGNYTEHANQKVLRHVIAENEKHG